jgi:predicted methyltransferase
MRFGSQLSSALVGGLLSFFWAVPCGLQAQTHAPAATHPTSTPYTGDLSIFEDPARDQTLQVERVMDELHLRPGANVGDIGAGGGWFSVRAARRVAAAGNDGRKSGTVYAEDINPSAVEAIRQRAVREKLPNLAAVVGTPDDPKLPTDSLDAAVMLRVYHEVAHPPVLLASLWRSMRAGGRLGVIDHPGHGDDHGIDPGTVRAEVERAGFRFVGRFDFTKGDQNDYMLVFERPR